MIDIKFKINEDIIAREMISKNKMPTSYANYLWDKYRNSYQKLQRNVISEDIDISIVDELKQQKFFMDIIKKSQSNCDRIENNWKESQKLINDWLNAILKTSVNLELVAYIVAPEICSGHNIGNNSFIYGHNNGIEDINYDLVYLVHESLHSYFDRDDLSHAIIENICDVELAKYLNKSSKYYPYHAFTQEKHVKIYPFWNLYLNKLREEIVSDQIITKIKYNIDDYEKYRVALFNMNINELIEFLKDKINSVSYEVVYEIK